MARLQLDLSETADDVIATLMAMCDLKTKKDVVENALMLLGWAAAEAQKGHLIAAVDEQHSIFKEVQTPALMAARQRAKKQLLAAAVAM